MAQDGVIKFQMQHTPAAALPWDQLAELNAWRKILVLLECIGQTPARYDNIGFGNISCRIGNTVGSDDSKPDQRRFAITGTQTGGVADLKAEHYVTVTACYPSQNKIVSEGPLKPSSESMTHGTIYAIDKRIRWVMHGHCVPIWRNAEKLGIPLTDGSVPYGSPEMAGEVRRLFRESDVRKLKIFAMGPHDAGIVTLCRTAEEAAQVLLNCLAKALSIT